MIAAQTSLVYQLLSLSLIGFVKTSFLPNHSVSLSQDMPSADN